MEKDKTARVLSENIKFYMLLYNLTQSDLARALGVSPAAVRWWVQGEKSPRMKYIDEMCKIFHCTQGDLFSEDDVFIASTKDPLIAQIVKGAMLLNDEGKKKIIAYIEDISERFAK